MISSTPLLDICDPFLMDEEKQDFLETFKQGQESILATFEQIKQQVRGYPGPRSLLEELEEKIFIHLQFQSQKILPSLEGFFSEQRGMEPKLEFHRYEVKDLKIKALEFFDRYRTPANPVVARNFPMAFLEFRQAVVQRIQVETDHLLPLLEEFQRSKEA